MEIKQEITNEMYKAYQLASFFHKNYCYNLLSPYELIKENTLYLVSMQETKYRYIRITTNDLKDKISNDCNIETLKTRFKACDFKETDKVLDIHVGKFTIPKNSNNDVISIDFDYYSGYNHCDYFVGLDSVIKQTFDDKKKVIEKHIGKEIKPNSFKGLINSIPIVTRVVMFVVIGLFILSRILILLGNDESAVYIVLNADYKTFTIGLKQFYRIFTSAFLHGGFAHLLCNVYSLLMLGPIIENTYGKTKYCVILFGSIICGSLCFNLLNENGLSIGLSGGLYGLLTVFILNYSKQFNGKIPLRVIYLILLNILLNFLPSVAWQCHLGGAVFGFISYYMFMDKGINTSFVGIALCTLLLLSVKFVSIDSVKPLYLGTDKKVIEIYTKYTGEKHSNKIKDKLEKLYVKEGAIYHE